MKISYSAPGKIILSGEHSVVYGKPAFVSAVDLRLSVILEEGIMNVKNETVDKTVKVLEDIVVTYLQKGRTVGKKHFQYSYKSDIPVGRGMGSSAAFCVATVAALLHFYSGREYDKQIINSLAYQGEKYFHGFPSGVDVSASCFGGLIFYRKEFEFLKHISSLNFKIPKNILDNLYLVDSGKPVEDTSEMIKIVGKNYNQNPKKMEVCLNNIEKVTKRMVIGIVKEDIRMFQDAIIENEKLIEELGIVSEKTKTLLQSLTPYGCGKVTGAGGFQEGSGMILFYTVNSTIERYLKKFNIKYYKFDQDFEGVKQV